MSIASHLFTVHLHKKPGSIFSVTTHHIFEDSNKISPLPSLVQAEQTQPAHLSWCTMCSSPLPLDSLHFTSALLILGRPKWETLLQPATVSHLPNRGEQSLSSACWLTLLLNQSCTEIWRRTALHPSHHQMCRRVRDLLPEWGNFSLLLGEPSCSATPHRFLCKWCPPQGAKLGSWYDKNRCHATAGLWKSSF